MQRDDQGRVRSLSLARDLFSSEWQNRLVVATASTAHGSLLTARSAESLLALCHKLLSAATDVGTQALAGGGGAPLACSPGCDHCCHQSVAATPVEVFVIARFLQQHLEPKELAALRARLQIFYHSTTSLTFEERHDPAYPCPLLENGKCTVYEARPLACRGVNSLDEQLCQRTLHDADARAEYLAGRLPIPRYAEPLQAAHSVSAGLQLCGSELHGFFMQPLELAWGLCLALDDLDAAMAGFLDGKDPFASLRVADASAGTSLDRLIGRLP
jgi:Fe-S-cluster containining protein